MITWNKNNKYKKGIDIEAIKIRTKYGADYEVYLSNPYLGKKKVLIIGEECIDVMRFDYDEYGYDEYEDDEYEGDKYEGVEAELEFWVFSDMDYYLRLFFCGLAQKYIMPCPGRYLAIEVSS